MEKSEIGRALSAKEDLDKTEVGRALSALRRTDIETECHRCGKPITGTTKSRWCSPACSQAVYRKRKAEAAHAISSQTC